MRINGKVLQKLGIFSFITCYCAMSFYYGIYQTPNWDEEASIDIALGIRPSFILDSSGRPTTELHYERIISGSVFHSGIYEKHNNITGVFNSVMRDNSNSFLYYGLLHLLIKTAGVKIWVMRLFSVLIASLNIFVLFQLAHRLFNSKRFAWLVIILVCANPIFFHHSYEIRAYMPAFFFGVVSTYYLTEITMLKRHYQTTYTAYFLCIITGFLFHYFLSAIIAGQLVYLLYIVLNRRDVKKFKPITFVTGSFISLSIVCVWLWISYRQGGISNMNLLDNTYRFLSKGSGYEITIFNYFKQLFIVFTYLLGLNGEVLSSPKWKLNYFSALAMLSMSAMILKGWRMLIGDKKMVFVSCILFSALIFSTLISFKSGHFINFLPHYLIFILPVFVIWSIGLLFKFYSTEKLRLLPLLTTFFLVSVNMLVFSLLLSEFYKDIQKRNRSYPRMTSEKVIGNDLNSISHFGRLVGDSLTANDTIMYNNWKLSQQVNFFLRNRQDLLQIVIPTDEAQKIIIQGSRKEVFEVR